LGTAVTTSEADSSASPQSRSGRAFSRRRLIVVAVILVIAALGLILDRGLATYRVSGSSMEPTLNCAGGTGCLSLTADSVVVSKLMYWFRSVQRGDIVVFSPPPAVVAAGDEEPLVKRVVGLPGDEIAERDGQILINGSVLREPYISAGDRDHGSFPARLIPSGMYFVLGDNRKLSEDSRDFGPISRASIIGAAVAIYSPWGRVGIL
jgi:signal peptidase I